MRWLWVVLLLVPGMALAQSQPTCGNGTLEPGEVCDDGNQRQGDGCRFDCRGVERCGDGITDYGEACDDGNQIDGDGCSPACQRGEVREEPQSVPALASESYYPPNDPEVAFKLSMVGTLTLPVFGQIVGPSLGHMYAGEMGRGIAMSSARGLLIAGAIGILRPPAFVQSTFLDLDALRPVGVGAALLSVGLMSIDIWDAAFWLPQRMKKRATPAASTSASNTESTGTPTHTVDH
jgi:cysteine-rich repeat protein